MVLDQQGDDRFVLDDESVHRVVSAGGSATSLSRRSPMSLPAIGR